MTPEDVFLDDIREQPDDDVPRLIFADYLEDYGDPDRAEFIRTQIYLARHSDAPSEERTASRLRCEQLLETNWNRWVKPLAPFLIGEGPLQLSWAAQEYKPESAASRFRRGFIEEMESDARFPKVAPEMFHRHPIRTLHLHQANEWADSLAACRQLRWIEKLVFSDLYRAPLGPTGMFALRSSPHVERLWILELRCNYLGDVGVRYLASAPWLSRITSLDLENNGISADGITELVETKEPFRPRHLILCSNSFGDRGGLALADSPILSDVKTLSLRYCGLTEVTAAALARSPHLQAIESLYLQGITSSDRARDVIDSAAWRPQLRKLFI